MPEGTMDRACFVAHLLPVTWLAMTMGGHRCALSCVYSHSCVTQGLRHRAERDDRHRRQRQVVGRDGGVLPRRFFQDGGNPDEAMTPPTLFAATGLTAIGLLLIGLTVALIIGAIWAPHIRGKTLQESKIDRYSEPTNIVTVGEAVV